jgi:hypothetical protein
MRPSLLEEDAFHWAVPDSEGKEVWIGTDAFSDT